MENFANLIWIINEKATINRRRRRGGERINCELRITIENIQHELNILQNSGENPKKQHTNNKKERKKEMMNEQTNKHITK